MKKILIFISLLLTYASQGQISDAKITDTIALWIVPNMTKSITAAQVNAILDHLNNSKINKDSIVAVRTNAAEDTLFIKYKTTSDTIVLLHELDNLSDVVLTTPDASDMLILDDETMKWVNRPLIQVYDDMQDTLKNAGRGEAVPDPDSIYYALLDTSYTNIDSNSVSSFRTQDSYLPNWRKDFANAHYSEMTATDDNAKLAIIGDSYGLSIVPYFTKYAQNLYGEGGGYQPFVTSAIAASGVYCNIGANWVDSVDVTDTLILNSYYVESSTAGASIMISSPYFNKLRLFYKQVAGGGTFSYQLGAAGTATNVSTNGATAAKWCYKNFAALKSNPTDTVIIKVVSGAVRLYGFYLQNDHHVQMNNEAPRKLEVHNLAIGGTTVSQFIGKNATAVNTLIDTLDISAFIMIWLDSEAEDPYSNYQILIDSLRSAKSTTDYLILTPYNNYASWGMLQAKKYRALAKSLNVGYMDMSNLGGQYAKNNAAGLMGDVTHFNYAGASILYLELAKVLFQPTSRYATLEATTLKINNNSIQFPNSSSIYISRKDKSTNATNYNTILGYDAANSLTTGYSNTSVGHASMENNTTGYQNVASGKGALKSNTTGNNNSAIGTFSGYSNLTGNENTSVGEYSLFSNVSGSFNTAVGVTALSSVTDKNDNVAVGNCALQYNVNNQNTAVGSLSAVGVSGQTNNGYQNAFYGYGSGQYLVSGYRNVGIGDNALRGKSTSTYFTGNMNVAIGYSSMIGANSSANNSSVGANSMYSNTTGGNNAAFGAFAGYSNTTGANNIMIGYRAGYNETGSSKFYIASDSTSWANGMASGSKLLLYADQSNAAKSNHFMNIFAKVSIGAAKNPNEMLSVTGNASITGYLKSGTGSIADNDSTPSVASYNTFIYAGSANPVSIDALDDHVVGCYYTIIGNSNTYTITVIDGTPAGGDSFNLAGGNWVGGSQDVLLLYCIAADAFIEVSRSDN